MSNHILFSLEGASNNCVKNSSSSEFMIQFKGMTLIAMNITHPQTVKIYIKNCCDILVSASGFEEISPHVMKSM